MEEKLNKLLQALQGYHPQRIILFGSVARGEADADSDLDVLVIKETTDPFVHRLEAIVADGRRRKPLYPLSPPRRQHRL